MHFLGIEDDAFVRGDIPMTKRDIRILTLVKARIGAADTILDIGAGTGSLSIEAALSAPQGKVYAVEKNRMGVDLIQRNMKKFGVSNISVLAGEAPEILTGLPAMDVILIGGSGRKLPEIFKICDQLLKPNGRLIINCVTVETLAAALTILSKEAMYRYDAVQVQITQMRKVGAYHMNQALNPIHILAAAKGEL